MTVGTTGDASAPGAPAWRTAQPPKLGISSCLLGEPVRYNGGHKRDRFLTGALDRHVEWVPVCPEVEIGLGTPRETLRVERTGGRRALVARSGADHTDAMESFARRRIAELENRRLSGYVLKSKSPSCGVGSVATYVDEQIADRHGSGLYGSALVETEPLLAIEEEGRLTDPRLREHFVERVFAHARLRALFDGEWRQADLVGFHARHKLQLMSHDPAGAKEAGRIVAAGGVRPAAEIESGYTRNFLKTLAVRASRGRHVNALHHALGPVGERLDDARRHDILTAITSYRQGHAPLSVPIALLRHHARGESQDHMRAQTYFDPFPADLGLRNHV